MQERRPKRDQQGGEFNRAVLDVQSAFRDWFAGQVTDGRLRDKEKLEQDKLKITARLVNLVVAGGMLMFREQDARQAKESGDGAGEGRLDESGFFRRLRGTMIDTLKELNSPEVNLLKNSLSARFRRRLREVFAADPERPERFPVKVVQDTHPDRTVFIGINLRDTRSLGEDIDRIERDPVLREEIAARRQPLRHADSDLHKFFSVPPGPTD